MTDAGGLRRVLELVGPSLRAQNAAGGYNPSSYATPLTVAAYALEVPSLVVLTATTTDAEHLSQALTSLLGPDEEVALWPGWDTHPLERVSPDSSVMATRSLLRWRLLEGARPRVVVASVRSLGQILAPEAPTAPIVVRRGSAAASSTCGRPRGTNRFDSISSVTNSNDSHHLTFRISAHSTTSTRR